MTSIFERIQSEIELSAKRIGISEDIQQQMVTPQQVIENTIDVPQVGDVDIYRVQFNNARGPYKGGIRFHHESNLQEVKALAITMMLKTSLVGIPMGGAKGGAKVNTKELSPEQTQQVARAWVRAMVDHIGVDKDIPAPDVNTNAQVMAWMLDEYESIKGHSEPGVFTGKPLVLGGSEGREQATSQGGVYALQEVLAHQKKDSKGLRVIVQGFGNVGSHAAYILHDLGYTIVGLSDSSGAVYSSQGIDPYEVQKHKEKGGSIHDIDLDNGEHISNEALLEQACDILIPAALASVITTSNCDAIQASYVLELANHPTDADAYDLLIKRGVTVIPDFLANAGGVTVSYLEWVQNRQQRYWNTQEVDSELKRYMQTATQAVLNYADTHTLSLKEAAMDVAVKRIAEAVSLRGGVIGK
jgi:glutamate dehydrogenase/leucine dehydrogenase